MARPAVALCPRILPPETQFCSGRGLGCLSWTASSGEESWACECDEVLWTGHGDLVYGRPTCSINVPAIRGLYGILAVVSFLGFVASILYTRSLLRLHAQRQGAGRSCLRSTSALSLTFALGGIICFAAYCVLGVYRTVYPQRVIGTDPLATTLMNVGGLALTLLNLMHNNSLFTMGFTHAGVIQDHADQKLLLKLRSYTMGHGTIAVALVLFQWLMLIQTEVAFNVLVLMFLTGHGLLSLYMSIIFRQVASKAVQRIRERTRFDEKSQHLAKVLDEIDKISVSAQIGCAFVLTASTLFAAWEGLRIIAYPYVYVIIWIVGVSWIAQIMFAILRVSWFAETARSQRRRLQIRGEGVVGNDNSEKSTPAVEDIYNKSTLIYSGGPLPPSVARSSCAGEAPNQQVAAV